MQRVRASSYFVGFTTAQSNVDLKLLFAKTFSFIEFGTLYITPGWQHLKTLIPSTNIDKKSLEKEFWIAICCLIDNKWQLEMLFLAIFYPRSLIVKSGFDCRLPGVYMQLISSSGIMCP